MPKSKKRCMEIREEMRSAILQKSLLYFARNGFAGTKISDLSKSIGIGQGTIYIYFESKEELFQEILRMADYEQELLQIRSLLKMPISAKGKLHRLSESVLNKLQKDEAFAARVALNTQMLLEKSADFSAKETSCQSALYACMAELIEQGQKEGTMVGGSARKLADYYWGVVYLYAMKRLFAAQYEMITVEDLERVVLNGDMLVLR
ncbi:MAG: TetR/AcrR family transcriptional regulator [Roseburia sp.]|nr:TetR/AcrR family transcriptional regulator [Roseburia sp.]